MKGAGDSRAALRRDLADVGGRLGRDEPRALVLLATRAWVGRARYGCLDVRRDGRDYAVEAGEELTDVASYLAAAAIRGGRRRSGRRSWR
jgi:hypothetical protein